MISKLISTHFLSWQRAFGQSKLADGQLAEIAKELKSIRERMDKSK